MVAAYGLILPPAVLAAPQLGCINVHASLLPRWRGAAPIERAIIEGDVKSGISIMVMDEGLDTGPVLLRKPLAILPDDTAGTLCERLAALGASVLPFALEGFSNGHLKAEPQPEAQACYAAKITTADEILDWSEDAHANQRRLRALLPGIGARARLEGGWLKVWDARPEEISGETRPGTVLDESLLIACSGSALRLLEVQPAGGKRMEADAYVRGHRLSEGTQLPAGCPEGDKA